MRWVGLDAAGVAGGVVLLGVKDRLSKGRCMMLHVGLDLSRKRVDVCLISGEGELVDHLAAPCDGDSLRRLTDRVARKHAGPVRAVVESMNGPAVRA
jgi:predicted NBD/HSP70 family sugar kinase